MNNSFRELSILAFLLGSSAICYGSHDVTAQTGKHNDNDNYQYSASGLERILNAVHAPSNSGYSYSKGDAYKPNHHQGSSSSKNGYQYLPPNNGDGYHYENPSSAVQNTGSLEYGSHHNSGTNQNTAYGSEYQTSGNINKVPYPFKESHIGQSSNLGYHYNAPAQNYQNSYGNFQPDQSNEMGYNYNKPQQSSSTHSNFKGHPYLPGPSSPHNNYQNVHQQQGFQGQFSATAMNGYQYENPNNSGYNYYRPQHSGRTELNFKGQSYLPKPPTPISSYLTQSSSHHQGYSYEKPSTTFKGESYLPLPTLSSGW